MSRQAVSQSFVAPLISQAGTDLWTPQDLLATLLARDRVLTKHHSDADRLLASVGGLSGLSVSEPEVLVQQGLVSPWQAGRVCAAVELGSRCLEALAPRSPVITCAADVASLMTPTLGRLRTEQVWLLSLDGRGALLAKTLVSQGGSHGSALSAKDVLRRAIVVSASSIVLVHNHPSGDPNPSDADVVFTRKVSFAAKAVGIPMLDHVILAAGQHTSLASLGWLDDEVGELLIERELGDDGLDAAQIRQ